MAYWNSLSNQLRPVTNTIGDGVNTAVPARDIEDSYATDLLNVDSHSYPALTVRKSTLPVGDELSDGFLSLMFVLGDNLYKIVDSKIYELNKDTLEWTSVATISNSINNKYRDSAYLMEDKRLYFTNFDNHIIELKSNGDIDVMDESPNVDYLTEHKNRLYGTKERTVYYCDLNEPNDWNTVDESGNFSVDTVLGEDITGVKTFSDHVMIFSEHSIHELYGTGPINYELVTLSKSIGSVANRSIVEVKHQLLWLGVDGVYSYNGGTIPKKISWSVDKYISRINKDYRHLSCAGTDGRRYYLAIPVDNSQYPNLVISVDLETNTWYVHDLGEVIEFINYKDELYYANRTQVYKLDDNGTEIVNWYWISKPFNEGDTAKRVIWDKLYIILDLPENSTLSVYLSTDYEGDNWEKLIDITPSTKLMRHKEIIPLGAAYDVDWVRIKFEGTGPCTIHEIQRYLRLKPW